MLNKIIKSSKFYLRLIWKDEWFLQAYIWESPIYIYRWGFGLWVERYGFLFYGWISYILLTPEEDIKCRKYIDNVLNFFHHAGKRYFEPIHIIPDRARHIYPKSVVDEMDKMLKHMRCIAY